MDLANQEILKTISVVVMPFLIAIVGWFLRAASKQNTGALHEMKLEMASMKSTIITLDKELALSRKDLDIFSSLIQDFRKTHEDIAILKHENATMWKRIDEIRERGLEANA